jgi:tRNA U34 5-carboxymethylaminomethyl modifying enzyme MnmG/GidA
LPTRKLLIFSEPEGLNSRERFHLNGISTRLPFDIQYYDGAFHGRYENAHILRSGGIEYDYFDPRALKTNFETRAIDGLFCWQINGTIGYKKWAAQAYVCWHQRCTANAGAIGGFCPTTMAVAAGRPSATKRTHA